MARYLSAADVKKRNLAKLGPDLGPVYQELLDDCLWLQVRWQQYVKLYGTKPERIDLLNDAAHVFARVVQDSLWEDTLLHLCRLTDPPEFWGKKKRLTIRLLPDLISNNGLKKRVTSTVDDAVKATKFARDWRNRWIAHRDLKLALNDGAKPLDPANRSSVRAAFDAVCVPIGQISSHYFKSDIHFDPLMTQGTALSLLYVLRDGLEADAARRERLQAGNPDPKDLEPPEEI